MKVALDLHAIWRGPLVGSLSFVLKPGSVEKKGKDIVKEISELIAEMNIKTPMLEIEQELTEDESLHRDMLSLVSALHENDVFLIGHCDGQTLSPIIEKVHHRIVHLRSDSWLVFPCSEVRFYPEETFEEPVLSSKHSQMGTHLFICPIPEVTNPKDVVAFLKRSRYQWKVLSGQHWILKQGV